MKPDIHSRADIEVFIKNFYEQVKADDTIGFIFNNVIKMNWDKHIPLIVDFWETILLDNPVYNKNAMAVHFDINKIIPLQKEHFISWLRLFNNSIDNLYSGKTSELAKTRAKSIADVMLFKMDNANKGLQ